MKSSTMPLIQSYVFSVSLGTGLYRHIQIAAASSLLELSKAILDAFDFEDDHAHAFFMDNRLWSDADDYFMAGIVEGKRTTRNVRLSQLGLVPGKKFKYVFDFGEEWAFQLRVLRAVDQVTKKPRVIRAVGDAIAQYEESDWDSEDITEYPEIYPSKKLKSLYESLSLSPNEIALLHQYFDAFSNLYGIIPLEKALSIYNRQNAALQEDVFLQFAEIVRHEKHFYHILGLDELYRDYPEKANPMDRLIIQEGLISFDVDDFTQLYQAQQNKPYYVPLREELLKYADDDYYEQTAELIALRDHLRKKHRLSKEKATDIADEMQLISYMGDATDLQLVHDRAEHMGLIFRNQNELEQFFQHYFEMSNNTRTPFNRGYTPSEMASMTGSRTRPASIKMKPHLRDEITSGNISLQELREGLKDMDFPHPDMQLSFLEELDHIEQEMKKALSNPPSKAVPRNAPCPCGSGRKFKHCCGKDR